MIQSSPFELSSDRTLLCVRDLPNVRHERSIEIALSAYSRNTPRGGVKTTFSTDLFASGPLQNATMTWNNWRDIRDAYYGLDELRKAPIFTDDYLNPQYWNSHSNPDLRPVLNLGEIRIISTVGTPSSPAGGNTEHIAITSNQTPVRFTMTEEARSEWLCHLQSSSFLPTYPICSAPLMATVKDTILDPYFAHTDEKNGWTDAISMGYQVQASSKDESAQTDDNFKGFRVSFPDGSCAMDRIPDREIPDSPDLWYNAVENHIAALDLADGTGDAVKNPLLEVPRLPEWLRFGDPVVHINDEAPFPRTSADAVDTVSASSQSQLMEVDEIDEAAASVLANQPGIPAWRGPRYGRYKDLPKHRQRRMHKPLVQPPKVVSVKQKPQCFKKPLPKRKTLHVIPQPPPNQHVPKEITPELPEGPMRDAAPLSPPSSIDPPEPLPIPTVLTESQAPVPPIQPPQDDSPVASPTALTTEQRPSLLSASQAAARDDPTDVEMLGQVSKIDPSLLASVHVEDGEETVVATAAVSAPKPPIKILRRSARLEKL